MKKLLLALAIGASISTGASAVTCGINQQPDSTNSYCEDIPVTTNYTSVRDLFNQYSPEEKEIALKESCDQLYQGFISQLIMARDKFSLTCDAVCRVKRSSFLPLGVYSKGGDLGDQMFTDKLRWLARSVMEKDPELTNAGLIYQKFSKECRENERTVLRYLQRVVDTKFGGDVNKALEVLDNPQYNPQ